MEILLLILIILSAILLVISIMIQDEQGEGLGGIFGGGSTTPFGSRSGNVLTRITAVLAAVFILSTMGLAFFKATPMEDADSVLIEAREKKYQESDDELWYVNLAEEADENESKAEGLDSEIEVPVFESGEVDKKSSGQK